MNILHVMLLTRREDVITATNYIIVRRDLNNTTYLNPLVMTSANNFPVQYKDTTDRDSSGRQAQPRLLDCGLKETILRCHIYISDKYFHTCWTKRRKYDG